MRDIKSVFSSPKKIVLFTLCSVLVIALIGGIAAFAITSVANNTGIGGEKASTIALDNAGLAEESVRGLRSRYEYDDGMKLYEVEFYAEGFEYDYLISADDGTILKSEKEPSVTAVPQQDMGGKATQTPIEETSSQNTEIDVNEAKVLALTHAGIDQASAVFTKASLGIDDGTAVYDLEFYAGDFEYDYELDASTGAVRDFDKDYRYD